MPGVTRRRAAAGLDALAFLTAAVQTGFGAFVAVFLADQGWTQGQIGWALTVQTLAGLASQVPAGALVDAAPRGRLLLGGTMAALAASAAGLAALPYPAPAMLALALSAAAGAVLYPALVALSRTIAGPRGFGERIGRNARYAAIGSGAGAALMGLAASWFGERAVLVLTALLCLPTILALVLTVPQRHRRERPHRPGQPPPMDHPREPRAAFLPVLRDRRVLVFLVCVVLFHLASAAILAVASPEVNRRAGDSAGALVAAFIIVPQIVVALLAPTVGRVAEAIGRRPVLLLGFAALPLRAVSFALIGNPVALVPVQVLEGAAAAVYGVLVPLIAADLTQRTGRSSTILGLVGLAASLGAALSTALGGAVAGQFGPVAAFVMLAAFGIFAVLLTFLALPETRARSGEATEYQPRIRPIGPRGQG